MAAVQLGKAIHDGAKAKSMTAQAQRLNAAIPAVDPGVQAHLNTIRQRRLYAEAGQSRMMQYKRRMAEGAGAQAGANIVRAAGTSPGTAQTGLLRSQNQTQMALMGAGAQTEQLAPQYMAMETPLIMDQADRRLSQQLYARDLNAFQGAAMQQQANNGVAGALGVLSTLSFGAGNPTDPGTNATDGITPNVADTKSVLSKSLSNDMTNGSYEPGANLPIVNRPMGTGIMQPKRNFGFNTTLTY